MLQTQLIDEFASHLVPELLRVLPVAQVSRDYVEVSVLEGEVVGNASFVADHVFEAFGYLHCAHVRCLLKQVTLDEAE